MISWSVYHNLSEESLPPVSLVWNNANSLILAKQSGFPLANGFILNKDFFQSWQDHKIELSFDSMQRDSLNEALKAFYQEELEKTWKHPDEIFFMVSVSVLWSELTQYKSELCVSNDSLQDAIMWVFLSWKEKPISIVVTKQLFCEVSWTCYTSDAWEYTITANFGLSETVIRNMVIPDTFVYESNREEVVVNQKWHKDFAIFADTSWGTIKRTFSTENISFCMTPKQIKKVAILTEKLQELYGKAISIERGIENSQPYLLSVRK